MRQRLSRARAALARRLERQDVDVQLALKEVTT
jgi:hypothetical protein